MVAHAILVFLAVDIRAELYAAKPQVELRPAAVNALCITVGMAPVTYHAAPGAIEVLVPTQVGAALELLFLADPLMQRADHLAAIDRSHRLDRRIERHLLPEARPPGRRRVGRV